MLRCHVTTYTERFEEVRLLFRSQAFPVSRKVVALCCLKPRFGLFTVTANYMSSLTCSKDESGRVKVMTALVTDAYSVIVPDFCF